MEFEQGKIITGLFVIDKITINGKIAEIELSNGIDKITAILKDNIDLFSKTYAVNEKVICKGKIRQKRKNFCLDLIYMSKNILEQEKLNKMNLNDYVKKFDELVSSVKDEDYKKILDNCFNEDVRELFFMYPASESFHHNYVHGLLQHSIEVVDICLFLSKYFKNCNDDLLICAGLLHDIGKLKSYNIDETNFKIDKTNWSKLLGHLSISALFVSKITPQDIEQDKIMMLYHLILSHHGQNKYGSPVECKMKEAYILHSADMISSRVNNMDNMKYQENWSENESWFRSIN